MKHETEHLQSIVFSSLPMCLIHSKNKTACKKEETNKEATERGREGDIYRYILFCCGFGIACLAIMNKRNDDR
jgi:hypothetical protein